MGQVIPFRPAQDAGHRRLVRIVDAVAAKWNSRELPRRENGKPPFVGTLEQELALLDRLRDIVARLEADPRRRALTGGGRAGS